MNLLNFFYIYIFNQYYILGVNIGVIQKIYQKPVLS
jgi:hypothetical protein